MPSKPGPKSKKEKSISELYSENVYKATKDSIGNDAGKRVGDFVEGLLTNTGNGGNGNSRNTSFGNLHDQLIQRQQKQRMNQIDELMYLKTKKELEEQLTGKNTGGNGGNSPMDLTALKDLMSMDMDPMMRALLVSKLGNTGGNSGGGGDMMQMMLMMQMMGLTGSQNPGNGNGSSGNKIDPVMLMLMEKLLGGKNQERESLEARIRAQDDLIRRLEGKINELNNVTQNQTTNAIKELVTTFEKQQMQSQLEMAKGGSNQTSELTNMFLTMLMRQNENIALQNSGAPSFAEQLQDFQEKFGYNPLQPQQQGRLSNDQFLAQVQVDIHKSQKEHEREMARISQDNTKFMLQQQNNEYGMVKDMIQLGVHDLLPMMMDKRQQQLGGATAQESAGDSIYRQLREQKEKQQSKTIIEPTPKRQPTRTSTDGYDDDYDDEFDDYDDENLIIEELGVKVE